MNLWVAFQQFIFEALMFFQNLVGNWGLAIILLTIVIRLLLMPLTIRQTKSMYEMQRMQPKIKELQAKYKDDKQKLQEETMKFYQENKINPFGGCLPLILQMPVFIALFRVLGGTAKAPGIMMQHFDQMTPAAREAAVRFYFLIPDIAKTPQTVWKLQGFPAVLPYVTLVLLFGLSIWLPAALMPGEKQQKMISLYMGVMFLYFGWISPAGVLLYWVTSSGIGIAQQQIQMKYLKAAAEHRDAEAEQARLDEKAQKAEARKLATQQSPGTTPGGGKKSSSRRRK